MAKNLADKAGLDYKVVPVETMTEFMELNGLKTVPAIFKGRVDMEHYIGGHAEFQRHVYSN